MAARTFKLERVLIYRCEMEKLRSQEFIAAQQGHELATRELQREEDAVKELTQEFCCCQSELGTIDEIRMYADFFARKRGEIKTKKEQVEQLDLVMNDCRLDLLEASRDKKVLESLKEKNKIEFRKELAHKERNFLDEISIQKKSEPT
ncbi:MAG TPA: flagellar export protein FliJ [Desulfuromonadales bacterium]|nr:flagellar export protein FliJ [Desulfuromonadales bacterium]